MVLKTKAMEVGYELPAVVKEITQQKMYAYSTRHGEFYKYSIHCDKEIAKMAGFPDVVCQGNMMLNYIYEMMLKVYREHWIRNSKLNVAYIKSVFPGAVLSAKGVVKEKNVDSVTTRLTFDVWVENQEREKVVVGNAEVDISSQ
jgi:acyl dehydratase